MYVAEDEKIATGHNNVAGLTLVNQLSVSGIPFQVVRSIGTYRRGQPRVSTSGIVRRAGYASCEWISPLLWLQQWAHVVATYEGLVTIRTRLDSTGYANYNAILEMPDPADLSLVYTGQYGVAYENVTWRFTRLEVIP